jgi:FkbM family methyltransferase
VTSAGVLRSISWLVRHPSAVVRCLKGALLHDLILREELQAAGLSPPDYRGLTEVHLNSGTAIRMARQFGNTAFATVLDVGASYGQFSVAAAIAFPGVRVLAFEPNPETLSTLTTTGVRLSGARVFPIALGDENGTLELHRSANTGSSSLLPMLETHRTQFPGTSEVGVDTVEVRRLDDVLGEAGVELRSPVLLKMDVQGFEDRVIRGATKTLPRVDWIIVEMSEVPLYGGQALRKDIEALLAIHGFEFVEVFDRIISPVSGETLQVDGLFRRSRPPTSTR